MCHFRNTVSYHKSKIIYTFHFRGTQRLVLQEWNHAHFSFKEQRLVPQRWNQVPNILHFINSASCFRASTSLLTFTMNISQVLVLGLELITPRLQMRYLIGLNCKMIPKGLPLILCNFRFWKDICLLQYMYTKTLLINKLFTASCKHWHLQNVNRISVVFCSLFLYFALTLQNCAFHILVPLILDPTIALLLILTTRTNCSPQAL